MSKPDTANPFEFRKDLMDTDLPPIPDILSKPPEYRSLIVKREDEAFYTRRHGIAWAKRNTHENLDDVLHVHEVLARQFMVKFPSYASRVANYGDIIIRLKICRCRSGDDGAFSYSLRKEINCPDCDAAGVHRGYFANEETLAEHQRFEHDAALTSPCPDCKRSFACLSDQEAHDDENNSPFTDPEKLCCHSTPPIVGKFFLPN